MNPDDNSKGDSTLWDLAESICNGQDIDWQLLESSAPLNQRPLIRNLELVSKIVGAHKEGLQPIGAEANRSTETQPVTELPKWGPLDILNKIGEGAFGEVFRAHDPQLDREVALKLFYPDRQGRSRPAEQLIEEGRLLARVRHPNVAVVHGAEQHDERVGIWMEYIEGVTLDEYISNKGTLDPAEAMAIGRDICGALAALHEAEVIHRDIKASNVMREPDGRIVVLDLGAGRDTSRLDSGKLYGTPFYAAPEVLIQNESSCASDIYSVGVLLYYMVTGQYPVSGLTVDDLREAHDTGRIKQLTELRSDLPGAFTRIVERALSPEPDGRFSTAHQFEQALTEVLEPNVRVRRSLVWWLPLAVMLAVVVGAWIWAPWQERPLPYPEVSPNRIAVAPLENRTGDPTYNSLGSLAAESIVRRFVETGAAETVAMPSAPNELSGSGSGAPRASPDDLLNAAARQKGAALLLSGAYYLDGQELRLQTHLTDPSSGELVYTFDIDPIAMSAANEEIEKLADKVVAAVAAHFDPWIDISVIRPPGSYEVFLLYQSGVEFFGVDYAQVVSLFRRALELDPEFNLLRIWIATVYVNTFEYEEAETAQAEAEKYLDRFTPCERAIFRATGGWITGDRVVVLNENRQIAKLAPRLSWARHQWAVAALELNRPRETIDVLTPYVSSYAPSNVFHAYWSYETIAAAYHRLADYERQIEYAELGLESFADAGELYRHKAAALAAMGQVEDVRKVVDDLLRIQAREQSTGQVLIGVVSELRYHGHPEVAAEMAVRAVEWFERQIAESGRAVQASEDLWSYAYVLRLVGRWQEAAAILVELEKTDWRMVYVNGALGVHAAYIGDRQEAQRIFEQLRVSEDRFSAASRLYWRACIAAHLGEKDRAVMLLIEAFARGLRYTTEHKLAHDLGAWSLHSDLDLEPLWHYPPFEELIEPQG